MRAWVCATKRSLSSQKSKKYVRHDEYLSLTSQTNWDIYYFTNKISNYLHRARFESFQIFQLPHIFSFSDKNNLCLLCLQDLSVQLDWPPFGCIECTQTDMHIELKVCYQILHLKQNHFANISLFLSFNFPFRLHM